GDPAAPIRIVGEKALERTHALGDALAVVESVDSDNHCATGEAFQNLADEVRLDCPPCESRERLGLNSDRESTDLYRAIAEVEAVAARPRQTALVGDVAREIGCIDFGLKSDQVVVTERGDQLVVIGKRCEDFRRRKRNMDEEADLVA